MSKLGTTVNENDSPENLVALTKLLSKNESDLSL